MKIAVIGVGYVGLVTGTCLAAKNHKVKCFDTNEDNIKLLANGKCPIYEPGLEELLISYNSNINFILLNEDTKKEILEAEAVIIAVGTPNKNGRSDLKQIETVARMLGSLIKNSDKYISFIIKSTVLPGTTDTFFRKLVEKESRKKIGDFGLGMNPEFLREGSAVYDFQNPDRIILGFEDKNTLNILKKIYAPWDCEKVVLNTRSAEMMKYVNNSLLATLISTTNEYSNISRAIGGINFGQVMRGVHLDNRWSPLDLNGQKIKSGIIDYLKPGSGFGGSCFPKDVNAILSFAEMIGTPSPILSSVIDVNNRQPKIILDILKKEVPDLNEKKVLLLGLSFKPNTDDVRDSISLKLIRLLSDQVKSLVAHDPISIDNAKKELNLKNKVDFTRDWKAEAAETDIIVIATNWSEYIDLTKMHSSIENKVIFDTRSLLSESELNNVTYLSVD